MLLAALCLGACDRPSGPAAAPPASAPVVSAPSAAPAEVAVAPSAAPAPAAVPQAPPVAVMNDVPPPLRIEPAAIDLGIMAPRAGGRGSVTLTNVSQSPITIAAVTPSCKCTTTSNLAGKVLAPGASESLEAVLEGASMPQTHRATLRVAVEGFARVIEVPVRGETSNPIRAVPSIINAVEGKPRSGRVLIESIDKRPFTVCAVGGRVPEFIGFNAGDEPRPQYLLRYDLDSWGSSMPAYLVVETDRGDCPAFDIWIRTEGTIPRPVFKMKDYRLNVGRIDVGGSVDVNVEMDDSGEEVIALQPGTDAVRTELIGQVVRDGTRSLRVRVTPVGPRTGLVYGTLQLFSRDREQTITMFGTVRAPGATGCVGCDPVPAPPASATPAGDALRDLSAPPAR